MFEIDFDRQKFKTITNVLSDRFESGAKLTIVPENSEQLPDGGVYVEQMTKMQTYSVQFFIPQTGSSIQDFDTEVDTTVTIGLSWDRLNELIGKMDTDVCTFLYNTDAEKVQLSDENTVANVPKIPVDNIHYADLPDIDYDCTFEVGLSEWEDEIDVCTVIDDDVYVQLSDDEVEVWSKGDTSDVSRTIEPNSMDVVEGTTTRLNGSQITDMLRLFPDTELTVEMKNNGGAEEKNMPQRVRGELFDGDQFIVLFAPGN